MTRTRGSRVCSPPTEQSSAAAHPSLSISCIETRADYIGRAARAVERTAGRIRADVLYWLSTLPLPDPLPGVDIVHIQIPDFTDYIKDINRKFLHLMPQVVATDFNRLPRYIGIKIALYDTRRQGRARACAARSSTTGRRRLC